MVDPSVQKRMLIMRDWLVFTFPGLLGAPHLDISVPFSITQLKAIVTLGTRSNVGIDISHHQTQGATDRRADRLVYR